ncbi:hypothetical protein [Streptococcus sobrinus]|nr:hypothetical protein [Streptococcus sobrinus]
MDIQASILAKQTVFVDNRSKKRSPTGFFSKILILLRLELDGIFG